MTVYFQGAEIQDFAIVAGAPVHNNTAGRFTPANARCAVQVGGGTDGAVAIETPHAFAGSDFWVHWKQFMEAPSPTTRYNFLRLYSGGAERLALRIPAAPTSTSWVRFEVYKSGNILLGTSSDFASMTTTLGTFDMRVKLGNPGSIRIYRDGVPIFADDALDLTWAGVTSLDRCRVSTPSSSANNIVHLSELIVADWNTINSKLVTRIPSANGAYSEWAGVGYTALNELTPAATYMTSGTADQRISVALTAFPALGAGERIERVKVAVNQLRDAAGPQKSNIFYRVAGADDHKSDRSLTVSAADYTEAWDASPATGTYWTPTELNASEPGVRSRA